MNPLPFLHQLRGPLRVVAFLAMLICGPALGQPVPEVGSEPAESHAAELAAYEARMVELQAERRAWMEKFKQVKPAYDVEWEAANERLKRAVAAAPSVAERRRLESEFRDVTVPALRQRHIFSIIGEQPDFEDPPKPQPRVAAAEEPPAHSSTMAESSLVARLRGGLSGLFELRHRAVLRGPIGVHHIGVCETQPTLLIEQVDFGSHSRMAPKPPDMTDFVVYAGEVAALYAERCPEVSLVRFAISPMPPDWKCAQGDECFLEVTVPVVGPGEFNRRANFADDYRGRPITSVDDMSEVLAAGRLDIITGHEGFFDHYLGEYFIAYSNHCSGHISNPVTRRLLNDQHYYDPIENRMVVIEGSPKVLSIEAAHVDQFDRRYEAGFRWGVAFFFAEMARQPANALDAVGRLSDWSLRNARQMRSLVENNCTSDRLLTVQHNLLAYSRNQPPMTGKYTTNKQPVTPRVVRANSAPRFIDAYTRERQELMEFVADRQREQRTARQQIPVSFATINDINELDRAYALAGQAVLTDLYADIEDLQKAGKYAEVEALQQRSAQRAQQIQEAWQKRRSELTPGGRR